MKRTSLFTAMGTGFGALDVTKRYQKLVIMTDAADVDGAHIRTLHWPDHRYMKPVLEVGCLYRAPPIYGVKVGSEMKNISNQVLTKKLAAALERYSEGRSKPHPTIQRSWRNGWSLNCGKQLWTLNIVWWRVFVDDAAEADKIFDMLMGSSRTSSWVGRKRWI